MNTGTLVVAITVSGILGGVAGALAVRECEGPRLPPPAAAAEPPAGDEALRDEVSRLRARLDEMQTSVGARADEVVRLRDETAAVRRELEAERKASAESREKLAAVEAGGTRSPGHRLLTSSGDMPAIVGEGGIVLGGGRGDPAFAERMRKIADLRAKTEEERWTAARDALGLSGAQEEELKAAIKERNESMRAAVRIDAKDQPQADGTPQLSVHIPDATKMVEARRKYDDRVNAALSADQSKKWRDDGYEGALGGGMRSMAFAVATDVTVDGK